MNYIKWIKKAADLLIYITMTCFIVLLFCIFQFKDRFDFLYVHLWIMLVFPIFLAWLVFLRNRIIDHFVRLEADESKTDATISSNNDNSQDKDNH